MFGVHAYVPQFRSTSNIILIKVNVIVSANRKTDNTMAKRKRTKGQATIYKTIHRKLKIEQHEPP
jgi:hypothetical protein